MAQHFTQAQIQTVLAKTGSAMKPYELNALMDALNRLQHVEAGDGQNGAGELTLGAIFVASNPNP